MSTESGEGSPFDVGALTDVGRRRKRNEDSLRVTRWPGGLLCIVADGMGGHVGGDVASRLAVEGAEQGYDAAAGAMEDRLRNAVEIANVAVWKEAERQPSLLGMGTTLVCAAIDDGRFAIAHVGDSRAYLADAESIRQLTVDHSWVAEQVLAGAMTAEEAAKHPFRGVITRCVGCQPTVSPDLISAIPFPEDSTLLLCSDGLTTHVSDDEIRESLEQPHSDDAARTLVDLANSRGGTDNITVVVVRRQRLPA